MAVSMPCASTNQPKLNKRDAALIRKMARAGYRVCELAESFDVHHSNISRILKGHHYT